MNIKVSHESPIALLERSRSYNDYDYCLVHLMEQEPVYRDYFLTARKFYDREVFLDTSVFELGTAFDATKYMDWAEKIQPNLMIIPDVLEDSEATITSWNQFTTAFADRLDKLDARRIGVVQGKTLDQIRDCYKFMVDVADVIAISFDMSFFKAEDPSFFKAYGRGKTDLERMCDGRPRLIEQLISEDIWDFKKPVHLLGCSLPQEFSYYVRHNIHNIRSVDTSNPVVHGLFNISYNSTFGLKTKVKQKLADLIAAVPTEEQTDIIASNIYTFREILNGQI